MSGFESLFTADHGFGRLIQCIPNYRGLETPDSESARYDCAVYYGFSEFESCETIISGHFAMRYSPYVERSIMAATAR